MLKFFSEKTNETTKLDLDTYFKQLITPYLINKEASIYISFCLADHDMKSFIDQIVKSLTDICPSLRINQSENLVAGTSAQNQVTIFIQKIKKSNCILYFGSEDGINYIRNTDNHTLRFNNDPSKRMLEIYRVESNAIEETSFEEEIPIIPIIKDCNAKESLPNFLNDRLILAYDEQDQTDSQEKTVFIDDYYSHLIRILVGIGLILPENQSKLLDEFKQKKLAIETGESFANTQPKSELPSRQNFSHK